jgi:hypothetical protein
MLRIFLVVLRLAWASPYSLLGCCVGGLGLLTGGKVNRAPGVVEFYGGAVQWLLRCTPIGAKAMTLGHTILGRDLESLNRVREHEMIHVKQYERWGIFFGPAYLLASAYMYLRGKHFYFDNPFEVEAYTKAP